MDDQNVQIVVKDKTFNIPKEILSSSSDYFKVMFSSNFRESSQKSVDIQVNFYAIFNLNFFKTTNSFLR